MRLYFFRYEPYGIMDATGEELPDDDAARKLAREIAYELAANRPIAPLERIVVFDECGRVVHSQLLASAVWRRERPN